MNNNIKNTKRNLSIMFSIIVFFVVLFMWIIFFSAKYFRIINLEYKEFIKLTDTLSKRKIIIEDLIFMWSKFENLKELNYLKDIINNPWLISDFKPKWFFNYILFDRKGYIILSNIRDDIDLDFVDKILDWDDYKIKQHGWFLIKKVDINNFRTLLILKKIPYSFYNYLYDILWFTFISLIFWIIIYYISWIFIKKAFIPVEENINDMNNFIHNAWHELKTPISVMHSNVQLLDDMKTYDQNMTNEMKAELLRLNSIIDSLLKLSNIDKFKNKEKNNLKDILEEIIKDYNYKIKEKNIEMKLEVDKNIEIEAHKDYFYIFLSNLIWNSIKYNKNWWSINIKYRLWELIIQDSGIWISNENINKIFDRFYKVDKSRNTDWFWVWLSLVKKISEIYNWKIQVKSEIEKWTNIYIKF